MQEDFLQLYEQNRPTVLFVTHSVDEALLMADRIVVMGAGRTIADVSVTLPRPRSLTATEGSGDYLFFARRSARRYSSVARTDLASWQVAKMAARSSPADAFTGVQVPLP